MTERTVQVPVSLIKRAVEGLLKAPGRDAILVCGELHTLLSQPTPSAELPRIEDMAPGTTFTATEAGDQMRFFVAKTHLGIAVYDQEAGEYFPESIDPSTIRDIQGPS